MQAALRVVLYCPDTHVEYDGHTPEQRGLGGGKTAQIRLCSSFASLGHEVTFFGNPREPGTFDGVVYRPFSDAGEVDCDLFIASTTGGDLDLGSVAKLEVRSPHRVVWAHGALRAAALSAFDWDYLYVPSNHMRDLAKSRWSIDPQRIFVAYNGFEEDYFAVPETGSDPPRDPHACVYLGYPTKGLGHAREVIRRLRDVDPRFHLDVIGGYGLRSSDGPEIPEEPGLRFRGLLGQRELARELRSYSYCIALQEKQEPFGIVVIEAQRAGLVVVASSVGAFPELIRDGINGFLVDPPAGTEASYREAVEIISQLTGEPEVVASVSRQASACPWTWDRAARTWLDHREMAVSGDTASAGPWSAIYRCPACRGSLAELADGLHCAGCGRFFATVGQVVSFQNESGGYSELARRRFLRLLARAASSPWREAVTTELAGGSGFLPQYILDESRSDIALVPGLEEGSTVLDLGTGYGTVAGGFARRHRVFALDNDLPRLAFCEERFRQDGLSVELVHGNGARLPFEDALFDLVLMIGVLEWAGAWEDDGDPSEQQLLFLKESARVLKPGGIVLIGIENSLGFEYLLGRPDDHTGIPHITYLERDEADRRSLELKGKPYRVRTHSRTQYAELLEKAGLKAEQFYWAYPDYRLWSALIPLETDAPSRHFLRRLSMLNREDATNRSLLALRTAAAQTGAIADFVGSYVIVARREP